MFRARRQLAYEANRLRTDQPPTVPCELVLPTCPTSVCDYEQLSFFPIPSPFLSFLPTPTLFLPSLICSAILRMASAIPSLLRSFRSARHSSSWRVAATRRSLPCLPRGPSQLHSPAAVSLRLPSQACMLSTASASPSQLPHPEDSVYDEEVAVIDPQRVKLAAARTETPLSIAQCLILGQSPSTKTMLKNMVFLNRELPVRFSKRIVELNDLPRVLKETEPFMNLIRNYSASFQELQTYSDNSRLLYVCRVCSLCPVSEANCHGLPLKKTRGLRKRQRGTWAEMNLNLMLHMDAS